MKNQYIATSPFQTKRIGKIFAKELLKKSNRQKAIIVGLIGELGSGKTTFLQGFAKGLSIKAKILSPTFVIIKKYEVRSTKKRRRLSSDLQTSYFRLYHIDCYRIQRAKEMFQIGFREILAEPTNIVAIEWADRIQKIMPKNTIWIKLKFIDKQKRQIIIKNFK